MNLTWIEVVDSIVKIGLGSIITAISGYIIMKSNQKNQDLKEKKDRFYKLQEQKAELYANFLAQSHKLVQTYLNTKCDCSTEEYITYLNTFGRLQISSSSDIKIVSYQVLDSVNEFIVINKNLDVDLTRKMRMNVNDSLGRFQAVAQEEITKEFN